jgi:hypothetical protein
MRLLERSAYVRHARHFSRNTRLFLSSQILAGIGSGIFSLLCLFSALVFALAGAVFFAFFRKYRRPTLVAERA